MEPFRREHADYGPAAPGVTAAAETAPSADADAAGRQRPAPPDAFLEHRPLLFSLAYRLLGSVHDAEDAVQDAYLRWRTQDAASIENPAAFLTTVVTRLCLDRLRSAAVRREVYIGQWLPEPLPTQRDLPAAHGGLGADPEASAALRESVSMGMLLLLERLSPAERAVFVLREAFDVPYPRIAEIVGHSVEACRQLFHRAGQRVGSPPGRAARAAARRTPPDPARDRRIVEGFLAAAQNGDLDALEALFHEDVVVIADGGGRFSAGTRPILGAQKAARLYGRVFPRRYRGSAYTHTSLNHQPALLVRRPTLTFAFVFDVDDAGRIAHLYLVGNPDKLSHLDPCAARPPAP